MKPNRLLPVLFLVVYFGLFISTWQFSHGRGLLKQMDVEMNFNGATKGWSTWSAHLPDTMIDAIHFNFTKRNVFIEASEGSKPIESKYLVDSNRIVFTGRFYSRKTLPDDEPEILPLHRSYVFCYTSYRIIKPYYFIEWIYPKQDDQFVLTTRLPDPPGIRYILVK
jgi:hypothetical protein